MRGLKLKSMSFDDLVALRDNVRSSDLRQGRVGPARARGKAFGDRGAGPRLGGGGAKRGPKPRGSKLKGRKVPPKYRNPKNRAETWAGRGATPRWLRAYIKSGHKLEEFAIGKPGRKAKR